jgi:hypothetical protein
MKIIKNPEDPEGVIWVLGKDRYEPESMVREYSRELAKLYQKHVNEQIGFRGTITAKTVFSTKLGKLYAENWAAAIGNEAQNPEEFAIEMTIKGVDKTGKAYDSTLMVMKKDLGFDVRIAVKEIPLHLDKDNYHHSMFPYWGMVREPPSSGDVTPGLGTMLFGGGSVWYSKLNHVWILASGKEMAEVNAAFSIPNLDKVLLKS